MPIIARFHPQVWINDYASPADPLGEVEFDVTEEVTAMGREKALSLKDDDYDTDELRFAKAAPEWVKEWSGPFYVEVVESVENYLASSPRIPAL